MKDDPVVEIVDLFLAQAIERYSEMESDAVYDAIEAEWPDQIKVLLKELFFKTTCGNPTGVPDFIQIERENGDSAYFEPVCSCEWMSWRDGQ